MGFKLKWYQQVLILLITCYSIKLEAATVTFQPEGLQCVCAGDKLIYNCSIVGGTATRWKGSLLECPLDVITLRHSQFGSNQAIEICNNGDISGYGIGVVNNCYTSQLNVTVRESFNNKTVQCILNTNEGTRIIIGKSVLRVTSAANLYPPPGNLYLAGAHPGKLVFNWTPVFNCSSLLYYSITSDCGICPAITDMATATCSDLQLTANANLCHFSVSSHICNLDGNPSSPLEVLLKVPSVPQVEIIPSYSNDDQIFEKLFILTIRNQTEDAFYVNGNISGSPISYTARAYNPMNGTSYNSTVNLSSCDESSGCPIELPHSYCSQSTNLLINISASNILGEGPRSDPFVIECTNNFVQVVYEETTSESTFSCIFIDPNDTSNKACCVTYRLCDHERPENAPKCSRNSPYNIHFVNNVSSRSSQKYCYTVTASNRTYTVKVNGTFVLGDNRGGSINSAAIAASIPIVTLLLLLLGVGITISVTIISRRRKYCLQPKDEAIPMSNANQHARHSLKGCLEPYTLPDTLKLHQVDVNSELREYITGKETLNTDFKRGHTYYEFTNEMENIMEGKEVLLQDKKDTKKWFRLLQPNKLPVDAPRLFGEGIHRDRFGRRYKVYIQSFGSGHRHLPSGSSILYNHGDQVQPDVLQLVPICSEYFTYAIVKEKCTVRNFCEKNKLRRCTLNMFLSIENIPEATRRQRRDVILMDKTASDQKLFTGPFARDILHSENGIPSHSQDQKWKVFVLLERNEYYSLELNVNAEVLYQDSRYVHARYDVINVYQDRVRMSEFVKKKLHNAQYEDGKAFYMSTRGEEDLLYCKKILRLPKKLTKQEVYLESHVEYFYAVSSTPGKAVQQQDLKLKHYRIFIQSTSQGSRCLKMGEKILYLKEYLDILSSDVQEEDDMSTGSQESADSGDNSVNFHLGSIQS